MDFIDSIKQLGDRVAKLKDQIQTEEGTKNAFVMPLIAALGYDVFNPFEVVPEFICDIGTKKGEKIDYAIKKDNDVIILIECKGLNQDLTLYDNQLLRYFHVSTAKFGVLTNGVIYKFYTDLEEPNKMDNKPFFEFNITNYKENEIEELKKFHKSYFNIDDICATANELKFTRELKNVLSQEFEAPSPEFVKLITKQVYAGSITAKLVEVFTLLLKKSISQLISDKITARLQTALNKEKDSDKESTAEAQEEKLTIDPENKKVNTTSEEYEAYNIVRAILAKHVDLKRITPRDTQSYFGVLLDDNNRKGIVRLYLNSPNKKYICVIDNDKKEKRLDIESTTDIFNYTDEIIESLNKYLDS